MLDPHTKKRLDDALPWVGVWEPTIRKVMKDFEQREGVQSFDALPRDVRTIVLFAEARLI